MGKSGFSGLAVLEGRALAQGQAHCLADGGSKQPADHQLNGTLQAHHGQYQAEGVGNAVGGAEALHIVGAIVEEHDEAHKEEGVEEVVVDNFDHNLHMAVQTLPADDDHPVDSIAEVLQKGYKLHDRLLRPAMVVVYN